MSYPDDEKGSRYIAAHQDVVIHADSDNTGVGDLVFCRSGTELLRITNGSGGIAGAWDKAYSLTADQSFATTSLADVTQMVAPVVASACYEFKATLYLNSPDTAGLEFGVNGPSGATINALLTGSTTTTAASSCNIAALNTAGATAFCAINGNGVLTIQGFMLVSSTAGNFSIQADKKTSGTGTVKKGSILRFRRAY